MRAGPLPIQRDLHPLHRLAVACPEQLEPIVRRAAMKFARKRIYGWLRETLRRAVAVVAASARQGAAR